MDFPHPLLGPYMQARAIANELRQQKMAEEDRAFRRQAYQNTLSQQQQEAERQAVQDRLNLLNSGAAPFTPGGFNELLRPRVVKSGGREYVVPTPEALEQRKLDFLTKAEEAKQRAKNIDDPTIEIAVPPSLQEQFGLPARTTIRRSEQAEILKNVLKEQMKGPQLLSASGPDGQLLIAGARSTPQGAQLVGEPIRVPGAFRTPPKEAETSEADYDRQAETDILGEQGPVRPNTDPDFLQRYNAKLESLKQSIVEEQEAEGQTPNWEVAHVKAEREIAANPRYKDLAEGRFIDIRKTPDFEVRKRRRITELKRAALAAKGGASTSPPAAANKVFPASQLSDWAKKKGYVDKSGKTDINRARRELSLQKWRIDDNR